MVNILILALKGYSENSTQQSMKSVWQRAGPLALGLFAYTTIFIYLFIHLKYFINNKN